MTPIEREDRSSDFWDYFGNTLREKTTIEDRRIEHWVKKMRFHSQRIGESPELWPEGNSDFKRCVLGIVTDIIKDFYE